MDDLWAALGLVLVIEGVLYAVFPRQMVEMLSKLPDIPQPMLRATAIVMIAIGWFIVWMVRS
ncbi:MAG: DUF2065 domain-containing protein [Mariprofundaceae bacterium]